MTRVVLAFMLTGCALTSGTGVSPEEDSGGACAAIDGVFANAGDRRSGDGRSFQEGLLAEHVISGYLPGAHVIDSVRIRIEPDTGILYVDFIGRVRRSLKIGVWCDAGWLWYSETRSGTWSAEGVQEKQYEKKVFLRQDERGDLVARVLIEAEFQSGPATTSQTSTDNFYRFRRL